MQIAVIRINQFGMINIEFVVRKRAQQILDRLRVFKRQVDNDLVELDPAGMDALMSTIGGKIECPK